MFDWLLARRHRSMIHQFLVFLPLFVLAAMNSFTVASSESRLIERQETAGKSPTSPPQEPIFREWSVPAKPQSFDFDAVFGDNMVLQQGPSARAAIYGFLGDCHSAVTLSVLNTDTHQVDIYKDKDVLVNATRQPFGSEYGARPCQKQDCPPYDMPPFNPWNHYLPSWKVLLRPAAAPGGNFTITATCTMRNKSNCSPPPCNETTTTTRRTISNVTFGDVWYCSGQSNMWLPLKNTFSRNDTVASILHESKYRNIRIMAGNSGNVPYGKGGDFNPGYGRRGGSNPWMSALHAVKENRFLDFGATCWYFAQKLVDLGLPDSVPIGLANTAIGGQRIEEFASNASLHKCSNRTGQDIPWWDAQLYATQVVPFVDMTIKGWVWYQGEANMANGIKGNSKAHVGYSCEMQQLVQGWRKVWSAVADTTDPLAPFGLVTLASSAGDRTHLGAMRNAQTANYGVVPNLALPNTFLAQAYDLDDEWGPSAGPCFESWSCCEYKDKHYNVTRCNTTMLAKCKPACDAAANTPVAMSGIHPRSKKYVGDRLGTAAFNTVYGGTSAFTGPTLAGCSVSKNGKELEVFFNVTLLRGESLVLQRIPPLYKLPRGLTAGGSQLYVQSGNPSHFCLEPLPCDDNPTKQCCPPWASGRDDSFNTSISRRQTTTIAQSLDTDWTMVNYTLASNMSIKVDLSPLHNAGVTPIAVRYAWGVIDCCDYSDSNLYVTHGCIANCPIAISSGGTGSGNLVLPANPFQAKIVNGACECVEPQVCDFGLASSSRDSHDVRSALMDSVD